MHCLRYISVFIVSLLLMSVSFANDNKLMRYTENKGQWNEKVKFEGKFYGGKVYLENNSLLYTLYESDMIEELHHHLHEYKNGIKNRRFKFHSLRQTFTNCNVAVCTDSKSPHEDYSNYYLGSDPSHWASNVKSYASVTYKNIYNGIDVEFAGASNILKYNYIIKPGASVNDIQEKFEGADKIIKRENKLIIRTTVGDIELSIPLAYQLNGKDTIEINCDYNLAEDGTISYRIKGNYNPLKELIIDPTLVFATFSGASTDNWGMTATYDANGNAYAAGISLAGTSASTNYYYPTTAGAYDVSYNGGGSGGDPNMVDDIAISKFNSAGTSLIYSTYIGGNNNEQPLSLVVNDAGELYMLGRSYSANFQALGSSADSSHNGNCDLVIVKFNSTGSSLLGSTFIGGSGEDGINLSPIETTLGDLKFNYSDDGRGDIFVDNNGYVFVVTSTRSSDFPTTSGSFQSTNPGGAQNGCLLKLDSELSSVMWSSYIGGSDLDAAYSVVVNQTGDVFVTGGTKSGDLSGMATGLNSTYQGGDADGFVYRISNDGSSIIAGSYIGTTAYDQSYFVQLDKYNYVYLFGQTSGSYPVSGGVYQNANSGQFIHKLSPMLDATIFSTRVGSGKGTPDISPGAFMVDKCENIYLSGWGGDLYGYNNIYSTTVGMPTTSNGYQTNTSDNDFYFMVLERNASTLWYATFFGGTNSMEHVDGGTSRFDKSGIIYQAVCGGCGGWSDMPTTAGAWSQTNNSNNCNMAVIKFKFDLINVVADFTETLSNETGCAPLSVVFDNHSVSGITYKWIFGDGDSSNNANNVHVYNVPGIYQVELVSYNPASCNLSDTAFATITVLPSPQVYAVPDTFLCYGSSYQLDAWGSDNYTWSADAVSDSLIHNPTASPDYTSHYIVTTSNNYCTASDTVWVEVGHPEPLITISSPGPICFGETVDLTTSGNFVQYSWLGTGNSSTGITISQTGDYIVEVTDTNGCKNTDTANVFINPQLNLFLISDTSICIGDTAHLHFSGNYQYSWYPTTFLINPADTNPLAVPLNSILYYITASDGNCFVTDSVEVTVLGNQLTLSAQPDTIVCYGEDIILDAGTGQSTYSWSNGSSSQGFSTNVPGLYAVYATNNFGCKISDSITIYQHPQVIAQTIVDTALCKGETVRFTSYAGSFNYTWSPAIYLTDTTSYNPLCTPDTTTTYYLTAEANGCFDYDTLTITVSNVDIRIDTSGPTAFCYGGSVTLSAQTADIYSWSTGSTDQFITADTSGDYIIRGQNFFGCKDSASVTVIEYPEVIAQTINDASLCKGESIEFTSYQGNFNYSWWPATSLSSDSVSNPLCTPDTSTTYHLITEANGCYAYDDLEIIVHDVDVKVDSSGPLRFCDGGGVTLTASNTDTYSWSTGNTGTTEVATTSQVYYLEGNDSFGCKDIDTIVVIEFPKVTAVASDDIIICAGYQLQLLASGGKRYTWTPDLYLNDNTVANPISQPMTSLTYTVHVEEYGCYDSTTVNVDVLTNSTTITPDGPTTFCVGNSVNLLSSTASVTSYTWNTGSNDSQINVDTEGQYVVSTTNAAGCISTDTIAITVLKYLYLINDTGICKGQRVTLTSIGDNSPRWYINRKPITNASNTFEYNGPETAEIIITSTKTCNSSDTAIVTIYPIPTVNAGTNMEIIQGFGSELQASGDSVYQWSPAYGLSCTDCVNPFASPDSTTMYYVDVVSPRGCKTRDSILVEVTIIPALYVPNCFTPNANNLNELFKVDGYGIAEIHVELFDRWGNEITRWESLKDGWDGTIKGSPAPIDVYVYKINAKDIYKKRINKTGTFTLLR